MTTRDSKNSEDEKGIKTVREEEQYLPLKWFWVLLVFAISWVSWTTLSVVTSQVQIEHNKDTSGRNDEIIGEMRTYHETLRRDFRTHLTDSEIHHAPLGEIRAELRALKDKTEKLERRGP